MNKVVVSAVALASLGSAIAFAAGPGGKKPVATKVVRSTAQTAAPALKSNKEKVGYFIGYSFGSNLKRSNINLTDVDLAVMLKGLRAGLTGAQSALPEQEVPQVMGAFQQTLMTRQAAITKAAGEKNQKEGTAFLAANKKKPGVVVLPSGLQYKELKAGTGATPKPTDIVTVNYRGTLINGKEFDSSYKRGEPATFPVTGIIPGWSEALQKMKVGAKWQLFIPANLAYGERGAGQDIGPNTTLLFEVELMKAEAQPAQPQQAPEQPQQAPAQPQQAPAQPQQAPAQPAK